MKLKTDEDLGALTTFSFYMNLLQLSEFKKYNISYSPNDSVHSEWTFILLLERKKLLQLIIRTLISLTMNSPLLDEKFRWKTQGIGCREFKSGLLLG